MISLKCLQITDNEPELEYDLSTDYLLICGFIILYFIYNQLQKAGGTINKCSFGERLKVARMSKKLTAEQLAEKIDISAKTIWRIESGQALTSLPVLINICNILSVSPEFLLGQDLVPGVSKYCNDRFVESLLSSTEAEREFLLDMSETLQRNRAKYEVKQYNNKRHISKSATYNIDL